MRLVLDTNVVVSGIIWGGPPYQLLNLARDQQVTLFTSSTLLDELADVLGRSKFAAMLAARDITAEFLMQRYGMLANLVQPQPIERTVRDADDDAVLSCALAATAEMIVTGDNDLLVLNPFRNMPILTPADALQKLTTSR